MQELLLAVSQLNQYGSENLPLILETVLVMSFASQTYQEALLGSKPATKAEETIY